MNEKFKEVQKVILGKTKPDYVAVNLDNLLPQIRPDGWIPDKNWFPIVCICGSVRFSTAFLKLAAELTEKGYIVVMPHSYDHEKFHVGSDEDKTKKAWLDIMHFQKIIISDFIYVVNVGGYVGASTAREIAVARAFGKPIIYSEYKWNYECDTCNKRFDSEHELHILRCDSCRLETMGKMMSRLRVVKE